MSDKQMPVQTPSFEYYVLAITLAACAHWVILALEIPLLDSLPYWKYKLLFTPIEHSWILAAIAICGLILFVHSSRLNLSIKLTAFILLGAALQYSFAFSKGQGLDGIRERIISDGHAEFARAAVEQPGGTLWVLEL